MTDPMNKGNRTIIIGAGHNGLVCAAYLAKAGRDVLVLEASNRIGGAAVTRDFAPGFRVSACAHLSYLLDASISRELSLAQHGLRTARADLRTVALDANGNHLVLAWRAGAVGLSAGARPNCAAGLPGADAAVCAGTREAAQPPSTTAPGRRPIGAHLGGNAGPRHPSARPRSNA